MSVGVRAHLAGFEVGEQILGLEVDLAETWALRSPQIKPS